MDRHVKLVFHLPTPRRSSTLTADDLLTIARTAEELGVFGVSTSDHPFPVVGRGTPAHHTYDPFVLLSLVAARTSRIHLVFSLLVAGYRNPFLSASMLATLDAVSAGRVVAGLGAGYAQQEFEALGARFDRRGRAVAQAATAMRAAWTGEAVQLSGDGWTASGNTLRPLPVNRVPLWRGGNSTAARRQAADLFDGWMPFEVGSRLAGLAATSAATVGTLKADIARYRDESGSPGDVCFVRTDPRWTADTGRAQEEWRSLVDAGVTVVESGSAGRSLAEVLDDLHRLVSVAT